MSSPRITLTRPDDWHVHLRDGKFLTATVSHTARYFQRAIIMPNLAPPVTTVTAAIAYRERILAQVPMGRSFEPLMSLYLTDTLAASEIRKAKESNLVFAVKYYPAGATTNSASAVTAIERVYPALECMADLGMPLLLHGEVTDSNTDLFDREAIFIERILAPLRKRYPELPMVLEHITTADAVDYVNAQDDKLAATITAHHLLLNRNHMLAGGIRPHLYCLPVLKRKQHQQSLITAATSGSSKFFLGTDTAPHARNTKETGCGCAGIFTAHAALELYAEVFEQAGALDKLEAFASFYGPDFYGLPRNRDTITLEKSDWQVPQQYPFGEETVVPLRAGETIRWKLV
ncbi:MAG: dihydroorotase [Pseudohongiellaceae bacterium]